jgi:mono/diheme cytochrome c family protein
VIRGVAGALAVVATAVVAGGCGTVGRSEAGTGDTANGKKLFTANCGSCHVLADAGTKGPIGPNLDDAFEQSRADGLGETTIQSVVRNQIAYPVVEPATGSPGMPKDIVEGQEAEDVAAYVASVAGKPAAGQPASSADTTGGTDTTAGTTTGAAEPAADGEALFAEAGCGGCHTLKAAGAAGSVGPNLDEAQPDQALVVDRVTNGKGVMPPFSGSFSAGQIDAIAAYVVASTHQ